MSTMTKLPGVPDSSDDVRPGMASYYGSGPPGQTCGTCRHRGYWRPIGRPKFNKNTGLLETKNYRTMACKKVLELSMRHGTPVKTEWLACSYWETKRER